MTMNTEEPEDVEAYSLVWGEAGILFRVPQSVVEPYRISSAQWAEIEASLQPEDKAHAPLPEGAAYIHAVPHEVLEPYRLTEADVSGYGQAADVGGIPGAYMVAIDEGHAAEGDFDEEQAQR
jgi:hypothetical protein